MIVTFRWLLRLLGALIVMGLLALTLAWYLASHSLPDYDATHQVRALERPLEIVRDTHAVPHIFADDDSDVFFGLGFAHAQDRLWQMTMFRRAAQGRLSELFGERTLPVDHLMRSLDLYGHATRAVAFQSDQTRAELQAYSDGVNAFLDLAQREALGRGAPEFFLFSKEIAPWTPADSIAIIKLMALRLTSMARSEVLRARLSLRLEADRIPDLLPDATGSVIDLPGYAELIPGAVPSATQIARPFLSPLAEPGMAGASNAFAAGASRAAAGAPLLATDPHLWMSAPSVWMLARMEFAEGGVIGATIPGLPGITIGRNADLAWGLTTAYIDDQDIYIERLDPADPDRYLTPDGSVAFERRTVLIDIKDQPARAVDLLRTRHGPVIPAPHFGVEQVTPEGHVAALAWTALTDEDRSIEALLGVMRARSVAAARALAPLHVAPGQNLMLADRDGIAMQVIGHAPDRPDRHQSQGRLPVPGWAGDNSWSGVRPFVENPAVIDPPGGILVNTNNQTSDAPFPGHISHDWGDRLRIRRASALLNAREFHTLDSFIEIQTDIVSAAARRLLPLMARDLWYSGEPAAIGTVERQRQQALEALAAWNGAMTEDAMEPLVYTAWAAALQRRLLQDELGPVSGAFSSLRPDFLERVFRNTDGAAVWCDVAQTPVTETCQDQARQALDAALIDLTERFGNRMETWRWGDAHQVTHRHEVLGDQPGLGWAVNILQDTPGGDFTLRRGNLAARGDTPFANVHSSGFRGVFDFADPDASVFIIATGQSGHLLSRHYDDLSVLWRRGDYVPMSLDPVLARGGAVGVTRLQPLP